MHFLIWPENAFWGFLEMHLFESFAGFLGPGALGGPQNGLPLPCGLGHERPPDRRDSPFFVYQEGHWRTSKSTHVPKHDGFAASRLVSSNTAVYVDVLLLIPSCFCSGPGLVFFAGLKRVLGRLREASCHGALLLGGVSAAKFDILLRKCAKRCRRVQICGAKALAPAPRC